MKLPVPIPCLCLVTDRRLCGTDEREVVEKVARAVSGGVDLVQLREKDLPGGRLLQIAGRLRKVTKDSALLFINERVDVAMACGADGVQLGEEGISVDSAREVAGESLLIGRSVHGLEGALDADSQGADFLLVGAIYSTRSHPHAIPAGVQLLSNVASKARIPFAGIGGIHAANVAQVMGAGASGAAVISAILAAEDPELAARELKQAIDEAWRQTHVYQHGEPVGSLHRPKLSGHG